MFLYQISYFEKGGFCNIMKLLSNYNYRYMYIVFRHFDWVVNYRLLRLLAILLSIMWWSLSVTCSKNIVKGRQQKRVRFRVMVFNVTFNNISAISWRKNKRAKNERLNYVLIICLKHVRIDLWLRLLFVIYLSHVEYKHICILCPFVIFQHFY
jgi:hypothetical protein